MAVRFSLQVLVCIILLTNTAHLQAYPQQSYWAPADSIERTLKTRYDQKFAFSVLVGRSDSILFHRSYGTRNKTGTLPNDTNTLYNIASVTKSFTAVAIMKMVEKGALSFSDSLPVFFTSVPAEKKSITVGMLLAHTSGLRQEYLCDGIEEPERALRIILSDKTVSSPGTGFNYSNQNYQLLGLIIEKQMGMPFEEFVRREILNPIGMHNTFFWHEAARKENLAFIRGDLPAKYRKRNWGWIASGGIFSTAGELFKFWKAIQARTLVSDSLSKLMFLPRTTVREGLSMGFGFFIDTGRDKVSREWWTRGTESWGHNAIIRYHIQHDMTIIVCTNSGEMGSSAQTGNRMISEALAQMLWTSE